MGQLIELVSLALGVLSTLIFSIILPVLFANALWKRNPKRVEMHPGPTYLQRLSHDRQAKSRTLQNCARYRDMMKTPAQWLDKAVEKVAVDWLAALIIGVVSQLVNSFLSSAFFPFQVLLAFSVFVARWLMLYLSRSVLAAVGILLLLVCGLSVFFVSRCGAAGCEAVPTPIAIPTETRTETPILPHRGTLPSSPTPTPMFTPTISVSLKSPPVDLYPDGRAYCSLSLNVMNTALNYPPPGVASYSLASQVIKAGSPLFSVAGRVSAGTVNGPNHLGNWLLIRIQAQYLSFSDSRPNDTDLCWLLVNPGSTTIGHQLNTPMPTVIILPY